MDDRRETASRKERPVFCLAPDPRVLLAPEASWDQVRETVLANTMKVRYGQAGAYTPFRFCHDRHIRVGAEGSPNEITWNRITSRDILRVKELPWTMAPEAGWVLMKGPAGTWVLRGLETGGRFGYIKHDRGYGDDVLLSPRGDRLALIHKGDESHGPQLSLYAVPTGKLVGSRTLADSAGPVAFSPDGTRLAVGTEDGWVRLFDADGLSRIHQFGIESSWAPASLALDTCGTRIATVLRTGEVRLWDPTGEAIGDLTDELGALGKGALFFLGESLCLRLKDEVRSAIPTAPVAATPPPAARFELRSADADASPAPTPPPDGLLPRRGPDLIPGDVWGERAEDRGGLWVDTVTGLPLFAWRTKDGAPMVLVSEGETLVGEASPPVSRPGFAPPALPPVKPGAFYIDQFPVTVGMYGAYLLASGAEEPDDWANQRDHDNVPVVFVHLPDALSYARWAGAKVPQEAEWVRAARGGDQRRFPWGPKGAEGDPPARYGRGHGGEPGPVDEFPGGASPFGAIGLAGNVCEWCIDRYPSGLEGDGYIWEEPDRNREGYRVIKGGAYHDDWVRLRLSGRWAHSQVERARWLGFRLVVPLVARDEPAGLSCWPGAH